MRYVPPRPKRPEPAQCETCLDRKQVARIRGGRQSGPQPATFEARFLCAAHIGDRVELDYCAPFARNSTVVTGRLWRMAAAAHWVELFLKDSNQVASDDPVLIRPDHEVTVTVREAVA